LPVSLVTNFRSRPSLLEFANAQFARILGEPDPGSTERFQPDTGRVLYERLRVDPGIASAGPAVHVVPFADDGGQRVNADDGRAIGAEAFTRRIRWLVESSGFRVRDPETRTERNVRYGDIAVLAHITTNVGLLLRALDRLAIRYTAHGG